MTRASLVVLSLLMTAVAAMQLGCACVAPGAVEALKNANRQCEAERLELRNENAALNGKLSGMEGHVATLESMVRDRDGRLADMQGLINQANDRNRQLDSDLAEARRQLAEAKPPELHFGVPTTIRLPAAIDAAIKQFAETHPGLIEYDSERGVVRFSTDLLFDLGKFDVKPDVAAKLADFAEVINMPEAQPYDVVIVGHTDDVKIARAETKAKTPTNWHLSVYRACAVLSVLEKNKVSATRMAAMGYGEFRPRVPMKKGGTPENRRVEVYLVPHQSLDVGS